MFVDIGDPFPGSTIHNTGADLRPDDPLDVANVFHQKPKFTEFYTR